MWQMTLMHAPVFGSNKGVMHPGNAHVPPELWKSCLMVVSDGPREAIYRGSILESADPRASNLETTAGAA